MGGKYVFEDGMFGECIRGNGREDVRHNRRAGGGTVATVGFLELASREVCIYTMPSQNLILATFLKGFSKSMRMTYPIYLALHFLVSVFCF